MSIQCSKVRLNSLSKVVSFMKIKFQNCIHNRIIILIPYFILSVVSTHNICHVLRRLKINSAFEPVFNPVLPQNRRCWLNGKPTKVRINSIMCNVLTCCIMNSGYTGISVFSQTISIWTNTLWKMNNIYIIIVSIYTWIKNIKKLFRRDDNCNMLKYARYVDHVAVK